MTSCPSTVSPVSVEAATFPEALTEPAATLARRSSDSTVISPPKSETASAPAFACALDDVPAWATTCASAEPTLTIEPSSGYAYEGSTCSAVGGAAIESAI